MSDSNTELQDWERHKSPEEVARYMRNFGRSVGRKYNTEGEIWNAPKEVMAIGMMHLILNQLEKIQQPKRDPMDFHVKFMREYYGPIKKEVDKHGKHLVRIAKFCDVELLRGDRTPICSISGVSRRCRFDDMPWRVCETSLRLIQKQNKRLASVRSLDDLENLSGIGKKTANDIRKKMKSKKSKQ